MVDVYGDPRESDLAGKYRLVSQIGRGGTADVHLAVSQGPGGFQKLVVLKMLKASLVAGEEPVAHELRAMFLNEARLAARLRHSNLVETYEVIEAEGVPVIVMEYLDGQPLSQVITRGKTGPFTLAMQLRVLADALAGLHAAHELADVDGSALGVVHRDVSPQNLFVTVEGQTKVLDFGIAKIVGAGSETEVGTVKGKLRYMAPEQLGGEVLDRRADLYAAGVILWEALSGERMWKGLGEEEIKARVRAGELPSLHVGAPLSVTERKVLPALAATCYRALSRLPGDRHTTAGALSDELEAVLSELPRLDRRDVGATVAGLFADLRSQSRVAIERELGSLRGATPVPVMRFETSSRLRSGGLSLPAAAVHREGALASRPARPSRGRRQAALFAVAGGLVSAALLAAWGSLALSRRARSPRGATSHEVTIEPLRSPPPSPSVEPAAPPTMLPVKGLTASRVGSPKRRARAGPRGGAIARDHREVEAGPSAPPALREHAEAPASPDCTHPFFIDAGGIKRFRLECR